MSEQKMPEPCEFLQAYEDAYAAGIERGRQQGLAEASRLERERLEPLRVAVEAARAAARRHLASATDDDFKALLKANGTVVSAVITLLEQTE